VFATSLALLQKSFISFSPTFRLGFSVTPPQNWNHLNGFSWMATQQHLVPSTYDFMSFRSFCLTIKTCRENH